jgi:MFS family permease
LTAQLTKSPAAVTAVQGLPWVVIGLGAGALVDRRDLRSTMVGVDMVRAVLIAVLAIGVAAHVMSLPLIYLTAFVTGVGSMLRDTAATTAVPRLINDDELERANGHLVAGGIVGNELAGPAVGGWLFGVAAALPFALNAGSLGIAILLLLTLPSVFGPLPRPPDSVGVLRATTGDIRAGLAWLRRDRPVRDLVVAVGMVAAADGAYLAVLVLYVTQVLQRSPAVYGFLLAVGAVGGIAAGAGCARLTRWIGAQRLLGAAGAIAGGTLAAVAGIQAPILAGVAPLLGAAALIARGHRPQSPRGA